MKISLRFPKSPVMWTCKTSTPRTFRTYPRLTEYLRAVLRTDRQHRTEQDINILERATSFLSFFANISLLDPQNRFDSHRRSCAHLYHRAYLAGQFVCRYSSRCSADDFPSEFYIVLSGEVGIFPPRLDELITKESRVLETIKKVLSPDGSPLNLHIEQVLNLVDINRFMLEEREFLVNILKFDNNKVVFKPAYLRKKLGELPEWALSAADFYHHVTSSDQNGLLKYEKANSIVKGGMFGEVALINAKNRNAHCVAMADTELGLLGIKEYDLILKKLQDQEHKFKRNFFERVVLKDQNLWDQAKSLMSYFEKKKYSRGQHLYRKGEVNQKVYIITEGQVVFWDNLMIYQKQEKELKWINKQPRRKRVEILLLKEGESIGEEEIFDQSANQPQVFNATFDSETIVYECKASVLRNAAQGSTALRNFLKSQSELKLQIKEELKRVINKKIQDLTTYAEPDLQVIKSPNPKTTGSELQIIQKSFDQRSSDPQCSSHISQIIKSKYHREKFLDMVTRTKPLRPIVLASGELAPNPSVVTSKQLEAINPIQMKERKQREDIFRISSSHIKNSQSLNSAELAETLKSAIGKVTKTSKAKLLSRLKLELCSKGAANNATRRQTPRNSFLLCSALGTRKNRSELVSPTLSKGHNESSIITNLKEEALKRELSLGRPTRIITPNFLLNGESMGVGKELCSSMKKLSASSHIKPALPNIRNQLNNFVSKSSKTLVTSPMEYLLL